MNYELRKSLIRKLLLLLNSSFLLLTLACAPGAQAQGPNIIVGNPNNRPVPVKPVAGATTVKSTAFEASHVLKSSAGELVSLHCFNSKASAQYILIMNAASLPANGAVTLLYPPIKVPADSNVSLVFPVPLTAVTGITVCNSSTGSFTKTIGSADCAFTAQVQ